ncbi:MAG: hypothetical protein COA78_27105 [Blastopirellula sp.]|nr:MAG: hypothetical protein COA78_27105 [Blastopirellula sp.]
MDYLKSVSGLLLLLLCTSILPARTWTDTKGESFEGDFVRLTDDNQVVVKKSGTEEVYTIPMDRFSGTDQSYVKAQVEAAKKASEGDSKKKSTGNLMKLRTWTSGSGEGKKAKFVRMHEGKVVLKIGSRVGSVEFSQFSKEDQEFLRTELEAIGKGDQIPTGNGSGDGYGGDGGEYGSDCYADYGSDCGSDEGDMPDDYDCSPDYGSDCGSDCGDMPDDGSYRVPTYGDGEEGSSDSYCSYDGCGGDDYESYDCGCGGDDYESYDCGGGGDYESYDCGGDDYDSYDSGGDVAYNSNSGGGGSYETSQKQCMSCKQIVPGHLKAGDKCPHCKVTFSFEQDENGKVIGRAPLAGFSIGGVVIVVIGIGIRIYMFSNK